MVRETPEVSLRKTKRTNSVEERRGSLEKEKEGSLKSPHKPAQDSRNMNGLFQNGSQVRQITTLLKFTVL